MNKINIQDFEIVSGIEVLLLISIFIFKVLCNYHSIVLLEFHAQCLWEFLPNFAKHSCLNEEETLSIKSREFLLGYKENCFRNSNTISLWMRKNVSQNSKSNIPWFVRNFRKIDSMIRREIVLQLDNICRSEILLFGKDTFRNLKKIFRDSEKNCFKTLREFMR